MKLKANRLRHGFHRRSLVYQATVIAFFGGLIVSSIFSAGQLYFEYQRDQKIALQQIDDMVRVFQPQLEASISHDDKDSVRRIVESLQRDQSIASVEATDTGFDSISSVSSTKKADWVTLTYPLGYYDQNHLQKIGTLKVTLTKAEFLEDFRVRTTSVILINIFTFLSLAFVSAWCFYRKVTIPILNIQQMTHRYSEAQLKSIVGFSVPTHYGSQNELDILQWDIGQLQTNFQSAFEMQKKNEHQIRQTEVQLQKEQQKIKLMQRLDSIGQITAQVVHDFGNLMMVIQGKAAILDRHLQEDSQKKYTQDIRKAVIRAQTLVTKLLQITRYQEVEKKLVSPLQMIFDLQDLLKTAVGGQIELIVPDPLGHVDHLGLKSELEASSFENALLNLCVNARDAMKDGGTITIGFSTLVKARKNYLVVSVSDMGCGIPKEIQEKIFEPFFTTKEAGKGTGLGLAQVNEFVKEAGGWLDLKSSPAGSTFILYLPEFEEVRLRMAA